MRLYIGTYTKLGGQGIYLSSCNEQTGAMTSPDLVMGTVDPSFLAIHPNGQYLYAVNEESVGYVRSFAIDAGSGQLRQLNTMPSGGGSPCHISIDPSGRCAMVANYADGKVASFSIEPGGRLVGPKSEAEHYMFEHGPDKSRQMGPHAHCIVPDPAGKFAFSCDLGLDKVIIYHLNPATADLRMTQPRFVSTPAGSGPRHIAFHPNGKFAYVITEMGNTLCAFSYDSSSGMLNPIQVISSLVENFHGQNHGAAVIVHKSGKFLYASNRGENTIAVFAVDADSGQLQPLSRHSTEGKNPRDFTIDPSGELLVVANQDTNNIVPLRIDPATGALSRAGDAIQVPAPVCVVFD